MDEFGRDTLHPKLAQFQARCKDRKKRLEELLGRINDIKRPNKSGLGLGYSDETERPARGGLGLGYSDETERPARGGQSHPASSSSFLMNRVWFQPLFLTPTSPLSSPMQEEIESLLEAFEEIFADVRVDLQGMTYLLHKLNRVRYSLPGRYLCSFLQLSLPSLLAPFIVLESVESAVRLWGRSDGRDRRGAYLRCVVANSLHSISNTSSCEVDFAAKGGDVTPSIDEDSLFEYCVSDFTKQSWFQQLEKFCRDLDWLNVTKARNIAAVDLTGDDESGATKETAATPPAVRVTDFDLSPDASDAAIGEHKRVLFQV